MTSLVVCANELMIAVACLQFLAMLAHSSEFENVAVREEELPELDQLCLHQCPFDVRGGPENKHGKVNILLQVCASPPRDGRGQTSGVPPVLHSRRMHVASFQLSHEKLCSGSGRHQPAHHPAGRMFHTFVIPLQCSVR